MKYFLSLLLFLFASYPAYASKNSESALDRVVRTGELRCSYSPYNPMLIIDPNTGELSGIFYDILNSIGTRIGVHVKWVEEVSFGNINAGFVTGRYDAFCAGLWPSGNRAKNTVFSNPLFYDPVSIFVRKEDSRFDKDWRLLNSKDHKIAITEGDATEVMATAVLPEAIPVFLSENQTIADEVNNVVSGKATATFRDLITAKNYLENNPDTIKNVSEGKPIFMYPLTIGMNKGEYGLKTLLDTVIAELHDDKTIEKIIKKHMGTDSNLFYYSKTEYKAFVD